MKTTASASPVPQLVTSTQLGRYPADSPIHAVLAFWQALQYGDVLSARHLAADVAATMPPTAFEKLVAEAGPKLGGLRIVGSSAAGQLEGVRVLVLAFAGHKVAQETPATLVVKRTGGVWQIWDLTYFAARAPGVKLPATAGGTNTPGGKAGATTRATTT